MYPHMAVLPMGLSLAFWLAQRAHMFLTQRATGLSSDRFFVDGRPPPSIGPEPACLQYCDNGNIISTDPSEIVKVMNLIIAELEKHGMEVHEVEAPRTQIESLGVYIDGRRGFVKPTARRVNRMLQVLEFVCSQTQT